MPCPEQCALAASLGFDAMELPPFTMVDDPVSFVVTAMADSPVFMTAPIVSTGQDLIVNVFSWITDGKPAPKVHYY